MFGYRFNKEIEKGCKHLLIQLPVYNISTTLLLPPDQPFSLRNSLWYFILFDFLYYEMNLLLHSNRAIYKRIHRQHHSQTYLIPFGATNMSIKEYLIVFIFPLFMPLYIVNVNYRAITMIHLFIFLHRLFTHSTYKLPYEKYMLGSHHYAIHRFTKTSNFGFLLPMWDMLNTTYNNRIPRAHIVNRVLDHYGRIGKYH